jgi:hypothetical protein
MAGKISMAAQAEVTGAIRERYRASGKAAKSAILDEFVAGTGVHRKHAIRLLSSKGADCRPRGRPKTRYGRPVAKALVLLWEASDRICSKRLKPMIPTLLPALERHDQIAVDAPVRAALLAVSPATIDRMLSEGRIAAAQGRRRRAGFSSAVRRSVPVRTFGALAIEALQIAQELFPFPLKGVDFDNDGAFMTNRWSAGVGRGTSKSRGLGRIARTTRLGWSRRTGRSCAGWSGTGGSRERPPPRRSPGSTRQLACT